MDTLQKLIFLHRVKSASGGSVSWETISGTLPLTLLDAAAKPIKSLIRYGKVTQDGTPTPSSPVDIVCNNGVVRMVDDELLTVVGTPEVLSVTASGHTPQTASVANLYAVDDYRDEQDLISGVVTRRIGVKVLDGTENWSYNQTSGGVSRFRLTRWIMEQITSKKSPVVCSHYGSQLVDADGMAYLQSGFGQAYLYICDNRYTSEADFKAHIAEQYAAGTPVIVMYQLAEETTESVTPQRLTTVEGTNTVSTVANIGGLDGSCEYAFKSSGSIVGTAIVGTSIVG